MEKCITFPKGTWAQFSYRLSKNQPPLSINSKFCNSTQLGVHQVELVRGTKATVCLAVASPAWDLLDDRAYFRLATKENPNPDLSNVPKISRGDYLVVAKVSTEPPERRIWTFKMPLMTPPDTQDFKLFLQDTPPEEPDVQVRVQFVRSTNLPIMKRVSPQRQRTVAKLYRLLLLKRAQINS